MIGPLYRGLVFLVGLALFVLGAALALLPGPLTIPPMLVGLWVWSTEFAWAQRLFDRFAERGRASWERAKRHPILTTLLTLVGLALTVAAIYAIHHYELIHRAKHAVGIS